MKIFDIFKSSSKEMARLQGDIILKQDEIIQLQNEQILKHERIHKINDSIIELLENDIKNKKYTIEKQDSMIRLQDEISVRLFSLITKEQTMKTPNFDYKYRGCVAKFQYNNDVVSINIYDSDERINYGAIATYDIITYSKQDLIYQAQCLIDDIRDDGL